MRNIGLIFVLLFVLASCKTEVEYGMQQGQAIEKVIIEAEDLNSSVDSRTSFDIEGNVAKFCWTANDTLGIFPDLGGYQVAFPLTDLNEEDAGQAVFTGGGWALVSDANYSAYYPFDYNNRELTSIPVSFVGQKQTGDGNLDHLGAYDYMYASGVAPSSGVVNFTFHHLGTLLIVSATLPADEELTSIQLMSSVENTFVNKATFDLSQDTPSFENCQYGNTITLSLENVDAKADEVVTLYVWTSPFSLNGDLTIKVNGKEKWYKQVKSGVTIDWVAGTYYTITADELTEGGDVWNGESSSEGVTETAEGVYEISTAQQLAWVAQQVNEGTNDFDGKTVKLMEDIELNDVAWTPIGQLDAEGKIGNTFKGTFEGNGKTVSNLKVNVKDGAAGLFGAVQNCIAIKDVNIVGANIQSNHYAGALVGFMQENGNYHDGTYYTPTISGCQVMDCVVTVLPDGDNGDKAGAIAGYVASDVKIENCTVERATITGYRDLGGICGMANSSDEYGTVTLSNNTIKDSQVIYSPTGGYKDEVPTTFGKIYGRGSASESGNTESNVTIGWPEEVMAWIGDKAYTSISNAVVASQANDVIRVKAGKYTEVINVKGSKTVTIQPVNETDEVTVAGIDHTSNANHSTVTFNNLTIDNSLQTTGWFTGTGNNLKPCVGAWGGNFTFENCKFIVSGESTAETGVMTWWTGGIDMTLKFAGCAFDGKDNHASARAMQIYGDVDLTVENCTFNTYKDYSLKYVGGEGHTATFSNNKVYNTKYFVELGSSAYPGKNCTVYFNESTLGNGIGNYLVANDEGQTIYLDGALAVADAAGLYKLAETATGDVKIVLVDNITLGNETERCMAVNFENATNLTIYGNDKILTLKGKDASGSGSVGDEYVAGILAAGANATIKNLTIVNDKLSNKGTETSAGRNTVYSFVRGETVTYEDVAFDGGVQVEGNETFRGCSFTETVLTTDADGYAKDGRFCMFIDHQYDTTGTYVVTLEDCTFDASGYGCVKVAGDKGANITVNVKDCTFTNTCPSNSWSKDTPKYDIKMTGANITVNDQGGNTWSDGANAGFGEG